MADDKEEKLIANALQAVFKSAKIPPELYEKLGYELKVEESEVVKVNITIKRGLVIEIEDDSHLRNFLNVGDIVLTVNDKVAAKSDFKLQDLFKEKGARSFTFIYIRMKCYTEDKPAIDDNERRDGYGYCVFALFYFQRVPMGLIMQSFQNSRVMVMEVANKTIGAMCMLPGDIILQINGVRQGADAAKTLETMATEMEMKGFIRITIERPLSEVARATAQFTIQQQEARDLPVPADCAAYIKEALKLLKGHEPKSIMKSKASASSESIVGFHERIHAESVIPSDIAEELLIKTPNRVPGVTVQPIALPPPPPQPQSAESDKTDKPPSVMGKPPSGQEPTPATPPPAKEKENTKKSGKSKKATPNNSKGRKKASAESITPAKGGKTPAGKDQKGPTKSTPNKKKPAQSKKASDNQTKTGGDTETGH